MSQLTDRWRTPAGQVLMAQVVDHLRQGRDLRELPLARHEGRLDLRGLVVRAPRPQGSTRSWRGLKATELAGLFEIRGARWQDLDFSHAELPDLRIWRSSIANCRFDDADCSGWRVWALDVDSSSFAGARLRNVVLGAWHEDRGNRYRSVDFSGADLRGLNCTTATFVDCDFSQARLAKVHFGGSGFTRCRFAGLLEEIEFYDRDYRGQKPDPNPMEDVDFSRAELRWVDFRNLDLKRVRLPDDDRHVLVRSYPCALTHALEAAHRAGLRGLAGLLANAQKWCAPEREVGIFSRYELQEATGDAAAAAELLRRAELACAGAPIGSGARA